MAEEDYQRKLTAILSADVAGYSLLMRDDEAATVRTITAYRKALSQLVQQYRGRVVDSPGDNILAEFTSVVDAVNCAVEIQRDLAERNAELSENRKMKFRIGINLGDVIAEGKRIYGDGVNIAARMEGLADVGGICISGTVYDAIESKTGLEYEFLGEQEVKNIDKPVRAYRVLSYPGAAAHRVVKAKAALGKKWRKRTIAVVAIVIVMVAVGPVIWNQYAGPPTVEKASIERMAFPLPEKPSIAVLPFVNMSGDDSQEYLSDGFTEDLITTITKIPSLFVISRQSTFTYKGQPVRSKTVAEDLGVRYILEGSIQKSGDKIRINVQLIDALEGHHLWSERYDRKFIDIFTLKDDIILKVSTELAVKLTDGEDARILARYTDNLEAWETYLLATKILRHFKKESIHRARELYTKALQLDPQFLPAMLQLAYTHWYDARFGWSESRKKSFDQATELATRALAIDETWYGPYMLLTSIHLMKREFENANVYLSKARRLAPATTDFHAMQGLVLNYLGEPHQAIHQFNEAIRLSPYYPEWYLWHLGLSYHLTGEYEKAIETFKKAIEQSPKSLFPHLRLAAVYSDLGREQEAQAEALEVLRIKPDFSMEGYAKASPFKDAAILEHRKELLRKAGLE